MLGVLYVAVSVLVVYLGTIHVHVHQLFASVLADGMGQYVFRLGAIDGSLDISACQWESLPPPLGDVLVKTIRFVQSSGPLHRGSMEGGGQPGGRHGARGSPRHKELGLS